MRDEKIALLEKVLVQLRNERKRSGIRSDGDVTSAFIGIRQTQLIKPHMPTMIRYHNHHSSNGDGAARRLPLSPILVPYCKSRDKNKSDGLSEGEEGMWEPLPFQIQKPRPPTPMCLEMNQQEGLVFDFHDNSYSTISSESTRSTKRHRHS